MATTSTSTKTQARKTQSSARRTATSARRTATSAERTVRTVVRDSAYATVGAGDSAVAFVRTLPAKAGDVANESGQRVRTMATPAHLRDSVTDLAATVASTVENRFDTLAGRGRDVVTAITRNVVTKRAVDQSKIARTQVKSAATSVRKAVVRSADAVEHATDKVGQA